MKITVLGCGSAAGVPLIGNNWGDCDPNEPRNRRTRASILVEEGPTAILVDTPPDMRQQLLNCNLQRLTAVLYTHAHADHCHGIDDLRTMNWLVCGPVPVYANAETLKELENRFAYIFKNRPEGDRFLRPFLEPHVAADPFELGGVKVHPISLRHGHGTTLGYRFNETFAYTTDLSHLTDAAFEALEGVKVWVVGCIRERRHHSHANLEDVLGWIDRVKPERAVFTHMDQSMDYRTLKAKLPDGVEPGYDGMVLEC